MGHKENATALLGQADRAWKAEEVNATRIAGRSNLLLSGITALIGLKLYLSGRELETAMLAPTGWISILFWQTFAITLGALGWSLLTVLDVFKRGSGKTDAASAQLAPDGNLVIAYASKNDEEVVDELLVMTLDAATDLRERNDRRESRLGRAQILFGIGGVSLLISLGLYGKLRYDELLAQSKTGTANVDSNGTSNHDPDKPVHGADNLGGSSTKREQWDVPVELRDSDKGIVQREHPAASPKN